MPDIGADQAMVVFLHIAIVVLLIGTVARKIHVRQFLLKVTQQELIEELIPIVRMKLVHGEGKALK